MPVVSDRLAFNRYVSKKPNIPRRLAPERLGVADRLVTATDHDDTMTIDPLATNEGDRLHHHTPCDPQQR